MNRENKDNKVDLLLRHGRVITMDPRRRILVDGAVAIDNGRVVEVEPDREVAPGTDATTVRDLQGALVHPGLIDAHVHAGSSELSRGLAPKDHADYGAVDDWLFTFRKPETDHLGALLSCMEMVANGTTAYSDTGGSFLPGGDRAGDREGRDARHARVLDARLQPAGTGP